MSETNGNEVQRLVRVRQGRIVAGVCAGLAAYFKVDVNLVRLAFAVISVFWGFGILLYLVAWAILPEEGEEGEEGSILESFLSRHRP